MKILASDFDGTLFFDRSFKDEDIEKIREFQKAGNRFGVCTGRPFAGVLEPCRGLIECDFYILSSGALILDKDKKEIYKDIVDRKLVEEIYSKLCDEVEFYFQTAQGTYYLLPEKEELRRSLAIPASIPYTMIHSLNELPEDIFGLSLYAHTVEEGKRVTAKINEYVPSLEAFQNIVWIDVARRGVSKGHGIQLMKEYYGYDEVAGIGDSYNDIPLLRNTTPSFTFHSSAEEVIREADIVVDSVAEAIDILMTK